VSNGTVPAVWVNSSGIEEINKVDSLSGFIAWQTLRYEVSAGTYRLQWKYTKDGNTNVGNDWVRVDLFERSEFFESSNFRGLNAFSGINIFDGLSYFRSKISGEFETVKDIISNGVRIGKGNSEGIANIIIDNSVNNSGALLNSDSFGNTVFGAFSLPAATSAKNNSGIGNNVMRDITTGEDNIGMGRATLRGLTTGTGVIGLGRSISDLPSGLTNTFFVNDGLGARLITIATATGAELPLQTNALIDAGSDFQIVTKKYFNDNLSASTYTLTVESGEVAAVSFGGNPKTATVTFSSNFPTALYHVSVTGQGNDNYDITVENKTISGFDINLNANTVPANPITWKATTYGRVN
jgi:hypothetical protein